MHNMIEKRAETDAKDYQEIYDDLAEIYATEYDVAKEKEILWKIIDLIEEAKRLEKRIIVCHWMKSAILAEKKDFVFPSEKINSEDMHAYLD